jgi:FAD/FMN-containing dehydrogenase
MVLTEQNRLVVKPEKTSQVLDLLKEHYREDTAIFFGGAAAAPLSNRNKNIFIDCQALTEVREHVLSDMVIAVETGITIAALAELLAQHGQLFPVDIQNPDLRLIDVIASGDGGYMEQGFGYMRSLVLGLELAYADGKCAKLGGRVVKNVTGFDLTKLVVGGRGVFGLPYLAHLRLFAAPPAQAYFAVVKKSAADLLLMAAKLLLTGLPLTALELVETAAAGAASVGSESKVSAYQYALIIGVMGSEQLVSSVSKQLRETGGIFNEHSREELASEYPMLVRSPQIGLEAALSRASAAALIDHLGAVGQRGLLRYRPGMGRFCLDFEDEEALDKGYDLICRFLSNTKLKTGNNSLAEFEQATIAKYNGPYSFSSHSQRPGDAAFGQLVSKLRRTFDPLLCFNVGVTFHGS